MFWYWARSNTNDFFSNFLVRVQLILSEMKRKWLMLIGSIQTYPMTKTYNIYCLYHQMEKIYTRKSLMEFSLCKYRTLITYFCSFMVISRNVYFFFVKLCTWNCIFTIIETLWNSSGLLVLSNSHISSWSWPLSWVCNEIIK